MKNHQRRALVALAEVRRTIRDRETIMASKPETKEALFERVQVLIDLEALLNELAYVTYTEGEPENV